MTTIRPIFGFGRVRVSRVVYHRDLMSAATPLPLAVMCDISVGPVYGLSLMARRSLHEEQLSAIGGLIRGKIAHPFDLLKSEFHWIWAQEGERSKAFNEVIKRHSASLRFQPSTIKKAQVPSVLQFQSANLVDLSVWARDQLRTTTESAYWSLMDQQLNDVAQPSSGIPNLRRGALYNTDPPALAAA